MITTAEVRKALWKSYKALNNLSAKVEIKTKRKRYIWILKNYIWFLRRISMKASKNLRPLDISDVHKVEQNKPVCITKICDEEVEK